MRIAGLPSRTGIGLNFLTKDQLNLIHLATIHVLEKTGVGVYEAEAYRLLLDAGCTASGSTVRIPEHLVAEALKTAPKTVTLQGRGKGKTLRLEDKRVHFGLGSSTTNVIDLETGERRLSTKQDVGNAVRLADALPNIDFVMSLCSALDTTKDVADRHEVEAMLTNTEKPIIAITFGREGAKDAIKMVRLVTGDEPKKAKPVITLYSEPIAPLQHDATYTGNLIEFAKAGLPVVYGPCDQAGATSPATLAGTLVQANAEVLSGLVIHQLVGRGAPFIYGVISSIMDMKTTVMSYGAPEFTLINAGAAQIAQLYGLPFFGTGGITDAKVADGQAVAEAALSLGMAALTGTNLIHDIGYVESGLTGCFEMIVICDELAGMASRIIQGIEVNDETLAVDVIDKVGPGGTFLAEEHTLEFFQREHWVPRLMNRQRRGPWSRSGGKDLMYLARETAMRILKEHQPTPLPEDLRKGIRKVVEEAEGKRKEV